MKVLVSGGGGQLARCLVDRAKRFPEIDLVALEREAFDLTDSLSIATALREAAPMVVINAAAHTAVDAAEDEPQRAFAINADGAGRLAEAARDAGVRLIHLSTDYVFDGRASHPYREEDPTGPLGVYGRSKLAGEEQVRAAHDEAMIVRTAWVCSPFGRNFVRSILAAARTRDALDVVSDPRGSPTSALDLADALLAVVDRWRGADRTGLGATYHVAGTGAASWYEVARHVMAEAARQGLPSAKVRPIAAADWPARAPRPAWSVLDSSRFESAFGFALHDWRIAFADIVERIAKDEAPPCG